MIPTKPVMDLWAALYRMDAMIAGEAGDLGLPFSSSLTFRDFIFLTAIAANEGCSVSKLATLSHVSRPTATVRVNTLVEKGLVRKTKSEEDKRTVYLGLTESASKALDWEECRLSEFLEGLKERHGQERLNDFLTMAEELSVMITEFSNRNLNEVR